MPFDGFVTAALTYELDHILRGGKIEKIHQPLRDELFISINSNREKHTLFISSNSGNPRIYLTGEKSQNPANPSPFCMLLRKHLMGGRIQKVIQHGSDRVIEFHILSSNELSVKEPKTLIVEIMGKHSNIIVLDGEKNIILDAIKHVSIDMSRERQILPKILYTYPPEKGKISFFDIDCNNYDIHRYQGISNIAKTEIIESVDPCGRLSHMAKDVKNGEFEPVIYYDNNDNPVEFYITPLSDYAGASSMVYQTVSDMLDAWYSSKESSNRLRQKSADLVKTLKQHSDKLHLKKQRLSEDLEKAKKGDTWKLYGELLTANLHNFNDTKDKITLFDYYSGNDVTIRLDPMLTPSENAQLYYKKYRKSKTAIEEKSKQLLETDESIAMLDSYLTYIDNAETPEDVDSLREELITLGYLKRKKKKIEIRKKNPFLRYDMPGGFTAMVGRNNRENDELTLKKAGSRDIWFHTKDIPGSHVILFTEGKEPDEQIVIKTAALAAYYSKGRNSQNVPVDYTRIKNVKKPTGAKPGMVIFKDNKTIWVDPSRP